jgi:hypothetical protein
MRRLKKVRMAPRKRRRTGFVTRDSARSGAAKGKKQAKDGSR